MATFERSPIRARIADMVWIEGSWLGAFKDNVVEEQWSGAAAGAMMGMFRMIADGVIRFYELIAIIEEGDGIVMRIRHFDPAFNGWEEKNDCVIFDLVSLQEHRAVWLKRDDPEDKWLLYEMTGDRLSAWFERAGQEPEKESRFNYKKVTVQ